jgi:hypothetical protein
VSTKNNLKDRIKKPNATQAFFNSYEDNIIENDKSDNNENDNNIIEDINNLNINESDNTNINKTNINDVVETYVNDNIDDVVVAVDNEDDYLRELASGKKPLKKKNKKVFTSFYMDADLAVQVDKIASRGEKGDKSKLINKAIRRLLEEYGVIKKK